MRDQQAPLSAPPEDQPTYRDHVGQAEKQVGLYHAAIRAGNHDVALVALDEASKRLTLAKRALAETGLVEAESDPFKAELRC